MVHTVCGPDPPVRVRAVGPRRTVIGASAAPGGGGESACRVPRRAPGPAAEPGVRISGCQSRTRQTAGRHLRHGQPRRHFATHGSEVTRAG